MKNPQTSQIGHETDLNSLGLVGENPLSEVLNGVEKSIERPGRLYASNPLDSKLRISPAQITRSDGSTLVIANPDVGIPSTGAAWVDFQLQTSSGIAVSFPATSLYYYRRFVVCFTSSNTLIGLFSDEVSNPILYPDPVTLTPSGYELVGYVDIECTDASGKFKTAGSVSNIIEAATLSTSRIWNVWKSVVRLPLSNTEPGMVSSSTSGQIGIALSSARGDHSHDLGTHSHTGVTNGGVLTSGSISDFAAAVALLIGQIPGLIPVGGVVATFPNIPGAWDCTATNISDAMGYVQCNGQLIEDTNSPLLDQYVPNINNNVFLAGNTTSGTVGGSNTKDISHTHSVSVSTTSTNESETLTHSITQPVFADTGHTHGYGTIAVANHTYTQPTFSVDNHSHGYGTIAVANHTYTQPVFSDTGHTHGVGGISAAAHGITQPTFNTPAHYHSRGTLGIDGESSHNHGTTGAGSAHGHGISQHDHGGRTSGVSWPSGPSPLSGHTHNYGASVYAGERHDGGTDFMVMQQGASATTGPSDTNHDHTIGNVVLVVFDESSHTHSVGSGTSHNHTTSGSIGATGSGNNGDSAFTNSRTTDVALTNNHSMSGTSASGSASLSRTTDVAVSAHGVSGSTANATATTTRTTDVAVSDHGVSGSTASGTSSLSRTTDVAVGSHASHTHDVSQTVTSATGGSSSLDVRPSYITARYLMRIK